uniref:ORF101 vp91 capsid n=1 Tax=Cydia pomonella granulosis virus TaxID=28289 RepID=A0A097P169_GVCP|nr:ORF101 vp91 capsid [Cydia pomonella granulovirus]
MLSPSTILLVVILVCAVLLFYNQLIVDDFDNESFTSRLNVLKEYLRTVGDHNSIPPVLAYVSHIVGTNEYIVTYFSTNNMHTVGRQMHNETVETFNFATQSFDRVTGGGSSREVASVSYVSHDTEKFVAHTDDGDVVVECGDGVFDGGQCVPMSVCDRPNVDLPLTEDRLNLLLFNQHAARRRPLTDNHITHPTAYIHCDANQTPHITECLNGEVFEGTRCVYDPPLTTNGHGLVTSVDVVKVVEGNSGGIVTNNKYKKSKHYNNIKTYTTSSLHTPMSGPTNYEAGYKTANHKVTDIKIVEHNESDFIRRISDEKSFSKILPTKVGLVAITVNKTRVTNKKFAYNLVNSAPYHPPTNVIDNLPTNKKEPLFMMPVNYAYPFDATPCLEHGTGHTFTSNKVASNQYFECLDTNNNLFLHSCTNNLTFNDGVHQCDSEFDCAQFENGTGTIVNSIINDNISFDTGASVCEGGRITRVTECDTGDFIADKVFKHPLTVSFNVQLPKQIFNSETNSCEEYSVDRVRIINDSFEVVVEERADLGSHMVGRVSKIVDAKKFMDGEAVSDFVTYSRDVGEVGLRWKTFTAVDCYGEERISVDPFDNSRYNVCEGGEFVDQVVLKEDEFVKGGEVVRVAGYRGECRYGDHEPYFDLAQRNVGDYSCLFTVPV